MSTSQRVKLPPRKLSFERKRTKGGTTMLGSK